MASSQSNENSSLVSTGLPDSDKQNTEPPSSSTQQVSISQTNSENVATETTRTSNRLQTKGMSKEIIAEIDTLSSYHLSVVKELDAEDPSLEHERLSQLYNEFKEAHSLSGVLKKFEHFKSLSVIEEGNGSDSVQFREVLQACDRVAEDSKMLFNRINKAIQPFIVKPKYTISLEDPTSNDRNKSVHSHKSKTSSIHSHKSTTSSIRSRTHSSLSHTSSRRSSRASILVEMEINSRVALAEVESKVEAEMATIQMEATIDELEKQKEQVKRSIRATKAQGELRAERKKHAIIAEAVEKEL